MTTKHIQELSNKIDVVTEKLDNVKIFENLEESRDTMNQVKAAMETYIHEAEEYNKELQEKLDTLIAKEKKLVEEYTEAVKKNNRYQEEKRKQQEIIEEQQKRQKQLDAEIEELEKALRALDEEKTLEISGNPSQLQLALYRGMGIHMRVEADQTVNKAILTSTNQEDIITFPIDNYTVDRTANFIWDFVSKGL